MKYLILIMFPALAYAHPLDDFDFQKALDCVYKNQKKIEKHLACKALCDEPKRKNTDLACHCSVLILSECRQPIKVAPNHGSRPKKN